MNSRDFVPPWKSEQRPLTITKKVPNTTRKLIKSQIMKKYLITFQYLKHHTSVAVLRVKLKMWNARWNENPLVVPELISLSSNPLWCNVLMNFRYLHGNYYLFLAMANPSNKINLSFLRCFFLSCLILWCQIKTSSEEPFGSLHGELRTDARTSWKHKDT